LSGFESEGNCGFYLGRETNAVRLLKSVCPDLVAGG
jgi:hypothetical protein